MRPYLMLSVADVVSERPAGADDDVHFPEALVVAVFEEYTSPGDRVFDPFAGYGTTRFAIRSSVVESSVA